MKAGNISKERNEEAEHLQKHWPSSSVISLLWFPMHFASQHRGGLSSFFFLSFCAQNICAVNSCGAACCECQLRLQDLVHKTGTDPICVVSHETIGNVSTVFSCIHPSLLCCLAPGLIKPAGQVPVSPTFMVDAGQVRLRPGLV